MCGIVGYIGPDNAAPILLNGLSKLEYRGYDSAGIAIYNNGKIEIVREVGKLANLYQTTDGGSAMPGAPGIGHTRWATHGRPSERNAHPHSTERFSLVHNGIIENTQYLKKKYLSKVSFDSETDTEIIVRMLQTFCDGGEEPFTAIAHIISEVEGSYALAIMDREHPEVIYAVKNKSPLLVGRGDGFNMIGSDAMAMIKHTNTFYELMDREFAVLTCDSVEIYTRYGKHVKREPFTADLDLTDTEKGTYPHYMLKEIEEQPVVIRRIIEEYTNENGDLTINDKILKDLKECDKVYMIACGTSYHAALVGCKMLESLAGKSASAYISSEFEYDMPILSQKPLFVFISQSGETADSRAVMVNVKEKGYKTLTITNVKGSTLSREAEHTLLLYAGPEISVASTKAYTAQIAVLAVLASCVAGKKCPLDLKYELSVAANVIEGLCSERDSYKELAREYVGDSTRCFYIGRGLDYFVCLEGALKMKEISYVQTEGFAAGELKHGTIALIEKDTPVIAIVSQENTDLHTRSNIEEVVSRGAKVLTISRSGLSMKKDSIIVGDVAEILTPLVTVVPTQYLAYYVALLHDRDIDKPRNLAKSVTVG
ncbi:MAG: glutamine--fructose-6-phosphate transaminase (isomerizing) [Clostridia bacterium]|nr:glutamine--fructose-6-phosphate transaminase (isomerizing) [Clostridia bacterium]